MKHEAIIFPGDTDDIHCLFWVISKFTSFVLSENDTPFELVFFEFQFNFHCKNFSDCDSITNK